jgi:uncharacterized membrane protein
MRKVLETLTLACLALMAWITYEAFQGPEPLPERIPMHFDAAGNANGWGPPSALALLPVVAAGLYLLITVISLLPTGIRSKVTLTPESRERIQALTRQMLAWIKAEIVGLFLFIQWFILAGIKDGSNKIPAIPPPVLLVVIFATVGWHLVAVFRAMKPA